MLSRAARVRGVGLALREALDPHHLLTVAKALDRLQHTSLWLPEFALRESFAQLGFLAGHTRQLRLATGVTPMASRSPVASALAAATVEDLSGGRAILGLGVSHPSMTVGWHGQQPGSWIRWASEYLTLVRQVLDGRETELDGDELSSEGFTLLLGARQEIPVVLAALGPKMLELGARQADGVLLNWTTPGFAESSRSRVLEAAFASGNDHPAIGAYVRVAAGRDAADQAKRHAEFYTRLPAYRRSLLRMGFPDTDLAERAARELILHGDAAGIAERVRGWVKAGVDPVVIYPIGDEGAIEQAIDLALDVVERVTADRTREGRAGQAG